MTLCSGDLRELSEETKDDAARYIAERLVILAGGRDRESPATWRSVAEESGCRVYEYDVPGGRRGEYAAMDRDSGRGIIAVNIAYESTEVVRTYLHELGHHALSIWRPVLLPDGADGYCYDGDAGDAHHDIARRVERLVLESTDVRR